MSDTVESVRASARAHPGRAATRRMMINATIFGGAALLAGLGSIWCFLPLAAIAGLYGWLAWIMRRSLVPVVIWSIVHMLP